MEESCINKWEVICLPLIILLILLGGLLSFATVVESDYKHTSVQGVYVNGDTLHNDGNIPNGVCIVLKNKYHGYTAQIHFSTDGARCRFSSSGDFSDISWKEL